MGAAQKKESMKIVPPGKKKCVWMEAGVVSYKLCDNNYDCPTCVYDHAMDAKVASQKQTVLVQPEIVSDGKITESWVDMMMHLPASQRKCRYMITGELDRKLCPNAYECGNCSFDQMMQERMQIEALPVHTRIEAAGFELADDFYYHKGHTWVRPEYGGRIRIGLDDFAQKLLGSLSKIDLPNIGRKVKEGDVGFQVKRNGQTANILSPFDGVVVHINDRLRDDPGLINKSPYEKGWLFIMEPTNMRKNLKGLYYGEEAGKYIYEEKEKLFAMANEDLRIAADGGESVEDIFGELGGKNWEKIVKTFLKT